MARFKIEETCNLRSGNGSPKSNGAHVCQNIGLSCETIFRAWMDHIEGHFFFPTEKEGLEWVKSMDPAGLYERAL